LDFLQSGIALMGNNINNMDAVKKKDLTTLNTLAYSHPFQRFCDDLSELK